MRHVIRLNKANDMSLVESSDHITDKKLVTMFMSMNKLFDKEEVLKTNYVKFGTLLHPFDTIKTTIVSDFIPGDVEYKITNAFMKIYEMCIFINHELPTEGTVKMFDIASAPGMFVFAMEHYFRHHNVKLDWQACSLMSGDTALKDDYNLYKSNPNRFTPCDVLKDEDIKKCIKKGKFNLVTGDIGIDHGYSELQELKQLDLQWGQAILGLKMVDTGGTMIIKMYTLITEESQYLLDTLSGYFEKVLLVKPYTSRVFNDECYIICIKRNTVDCSQVPNIRPKISGYKSPNRDLINEFDKERATSKNKCSKMVIDMLKENPKMGFMEALAHKDYAKYFNDLKWFNKFFYMMKTK